MLTLYINNNIAGCNIIYVYVGLKHEFILISPLSVSYYHMDHSMDDGIHSWIIPPSVM